MTLESNYERPPVTVSRETYNATTRDPIKKILCEMLVREGRIIIIEGRKAV
jgi:hypothetical protein